MGPKTLFVFAIILAGCFLNSGQAGERQKATRRMPPSTSSGVISVNARVVHPLGIADFYDESINGANRNFRLIYTPDGPGSLIQIDSPEGERLAVALNESSIGKSDFLRYGASDETIIINIDHLAENAAVAPSSLTITIIDTGI